MVFIKEAIRRFIQIIVGTFIFDFPVLNSIRNMVYKVIITKFGASNVIMQKFSMYVPHGLKMAEIVILDNVRISENVSIDCSSPVYIGENVWISQNTVILNHEHVIEQDKLKDSKNILLTRGLVINRDAWIGANVIILPSVSVIGEGAIIGAGSIVTKDVLPNVIVAGNPAKIIRQR